MTKLKKLEQENQALREALDEAADFIKIGIERMLKDDRLRAEDFLSSIERGGK